MSNYTKSTDFASKDALLSGNPAKIIKGTEIDTEFNDIATAIGTKADLQSPTLTGTPLAPTAAPGTNTTQIATTAFVTAADTAATTAERSATATLTNKTVNLTSNTLTGTVAQFNTALSDGDFATIAGTETLTNKTLTSPVLTTPSVDVINEATAAAGVTIDGVLIKDGVITGGVTLFLDTVKTSTSGTTVEFTDIPSWAKRVTVLFNGVSTSGTNPIIVQIGNTTFTTTGYSSGATNFSAGTRTNATTGFLVASQAPGSAAYFGKMTIELVTTNTYVAAATVASTDTSGSGGGYGAGGINLGAVLDRVRVTTVGSTDAFDAGSINISYE